MIMPQPLFPEVIVRLTGIDGNAFVILGAVTLAMREATGNLPEEDINDNFFKEATAKGYSLVCYSNRHENGFSRVAVIRGP